MCQWLRAEHTGQVALGRSARPHECHKSKGQTPRQVMPGSRAKKERSKEATAQLCFQAADTTGWHFRRHCWCRTFPCFSTQGSRSKRPKASLNWVISAPSIFILHIMLLSFQGFKITSLIICSKIKLKRKSKRNKIYITKRTTFPKVIICIFFLSNFSRNMLKPQQQKGVSNVTFCWQGRFSQLSNRVSYDFQCTVIHTVSLSL